MHTDGPILILSFVCSHSSSLVPRSLPSPSLLFLSSFFFSLPHCNLASTSTQSALHFCFYLPLFAPFSSLLLFFFAFFPFPFAVHFFHASSPSIFSCLVTGNIFSHYLVPSRLHAALVTCSKTDFFFFFLGSPIFCSMFLFCFSGCSPHAAPLHVTEPGCCCICICV